MAQAQVGVVVLNYKNYSETIDCIESVRRQEGVDVKIAVVENGSGNESWEVLNALYGDNKDVLLVKSLFNRGYSKGVNLGIEVLKNLGISFIAVANSDTVLSSNLVMNQILSGYTPGVGLIVPIIRNLDGSVEQRVIVKSHFIKLRLLKSVLKTYAASCNLGNRCADRSYYQMSIQRSGLLRGEYAVSGSFFLLSPDYFRVYNGLYPDTFLYYEEWATILLIHKAGLMTLIADCDPIIHKGAASTPQSADSQKVKNWHSKRSAVKVLRLALIPSRWVTAWY